MRGAPSREKGWWIQQGNWSFSWSVAHSLRWYLEGSTTGLKGRRVQYAEELELGDVIFMIFKGNGRPLRYCYKYSKWYSLCECPHLR